MTAAPKFQFAVRLTPDIFNYTKTEGRTGESGDCPELLLEVRDAARKPGFQQMMFSELEPDVDEALALLCGDIIPAL